jgi:hypothetical protein
MQHAYCLVTQSWNSCSVLCDRLTLGAKWRRQMESMCTHIGPLALPNCRSGWLKQGSSPVTTDSNRSAVGRVS